MVQLKAHKTAPALYALLLVLPTVVLGWLQWHQIETEYERELANLPDEADDAARRLRDELRDRLGRLLRDEDARAFHQYGARYCPDESCTTSVLMVPSPLVRDARPRGIVGWFVFDIAQGSEAPHDMFFGGGERMEEGVKVRDDLDQALGKFAARTSDEGGLRRATRMDSFFEVSVPLGLVAAHRLENADPLCLEQAQERIGDLAVPLTVSPFHVQFYLDEGVPRIVATRRVLMEPNASLSRVDVCIAPLSKGFSLVQGFFIDPAWLFDELPKTIAENVLGRSQRFVPAGVAPSSDAQEYNAAVRLVADLDLEVDLSRDQEFGSVHIAVDTAETHARFRSQRLRFVLLATMLAISLATGMALLLRSVNRELEQAERTENFVAAVTHELRTPLSAIRLHGEMLLDGWAKDEAKQKEYYRRIVRETERLSTLVERVLEKSKLAAGTIRVAPGDLNRAVRALEVPLSNARDGERSDVVLELADELPEVTLSAEGVASIVTNLVENARKYAPIDWNAPQSEPYRVVTRRENDEAVLEVLDRGPGVPEHERTKIFEAFYRVGDEKTRKTRGTGLGLHLVALHARAMGGDISVHDREGGGSIFRLRVPLATDVDESV
ncbi:MAG: HAMP domain-containing histidine kinase [Planctomycetes bacterium]|nr:HAMP domain-containing histidine kinase [Planctomycetota bacterium]